MATELRLVGATSGYTVYTVISNSTQTWNGTTFEDRVEANQDLYAVYLAETPTGSTVWIGMFPTGIPAGYYNIDYYWQEGTSPLFTDQILGTETLFCDGNNATIPEILPTSGPAIVDVPPNTGFVRAVPDYRGAFTQGTRSSIMLRITNLDGYPQDPEAISTTITDQYGNLVINGIPEKASRGFYVFDWCIEETQAFGKYLATWNYVIDGAAQVATQYIIVADDNQLDRNSLYGPTIVEFRLSLTYMLEAAQAIPVYNEQARKTSNPSQFIFTYPRWNQTASCRIYVNDVLASANSLTSGYTIDYDHGKVTFDNPLTPYDRVTADYNFRWFSDEDFDRFLSNAIEKWNFFPPAGRDTLFTLMYNPRSQSYIPFILYGAAIDALRSMMLSLQFQQPQLVFGGPQNADKAFANLETLKKNYEEDWKLGVQEKKNGPYVGLTRTIVTPEFTLPGGRSRWFRYLYSSGS